MPLFFLLLSLVVSAVVTALIIPKIILISFKRRLFDYTDSRKVHKGVVPRLGGVAFTPAVIITTALLAGISVLAGTGKDFRTMLQAPQLTLSLCALMLLYMEGITDDLIGVGYRAKFCMQFLCTGIVVGSGVCLDNLYGLFGIYELPAAAGVPLSVVLLVFIINAVNLIDGIDGLASGLSGIALFFLGCLFFNGGEPVYAVIAFAMLGALIPFFIYNVFGQVENLRKIFMGDCGSQTVGLVLGMLAIRFSMHGNGATTPNAVVAAFSLLMVPCLDALRVMLGRMRHGRNPFKPDTTHIHHKLLALGMSHRTAMVLILMLSAFFALLNLGLIDRFDVNLILGIDVLLWCVAHLWMNLLVTKRRNIQK